MRTLIEGIKMLQKFTKSYALRNVIQFIINHSLISKMMLICLSKRLEVHKSIFLQKVKRNHLLAVMRLIDFSVLLLQLTLKTNNPVIDFFVCLKGTFVSHQHCM